MTKNRLPPFHPRSNRAPARMSLSEFRESFPAESDYVERKAGVGERPLAKAITALSNTDGGVILIGVHDDGTVAGRALTEGVANSIHQAALTVHDPGRYRIRQASVDGQPIVVVSVAKRSQGFAQTADGQVLVRRGARSTPLLGAELLSFVTSRALERFDETDAGVALDEVDDELLNDLRRAFRWRPENLRRRLVEHKFAVENGATRLTIAGALLLIEEPREYLGKAFVEVLRYPDDGVDYDRRVEFVGAVPAQVEDATTFVMNELGTDLVVSGARRYEVPKIPEVVLREAIANAVAHRSYEELGRAIRIELRPDAVRINSPGGLPEPVTEENIRETQSARNIRVLSALRRLRLAEDAGRGVDVMQDSMAEALLDPPSFHDQGHSVIVTLPIRGAISPQERAWILEVERRGQINPRDRIPLIHAARGESLTNARVRELLGVDSRDARQSLQRLRDAGFVEQLGERGGATYILSRAIGAPAAFRMSPADLRTFVLELADEGPLTNASVRAATGLDRVETFRLLDQLVQEGRLYRRGERRGAHYIRARRRRFRGAGTSRRPRV
jgi:ATP-dependent DNA helicase RecG